MKIQSWKTPDTSVNFEPTIYTRLQSSAHELKTDCKTSWNTEQNGSVALEVFWQIQKLEHTLKNHCDNSS